MKIRMISVAPSTWSSNPNWIREPSTRLGSFMLQWLALIARHPKD